MLVVLRGVDGRPQLPVKAHGIPPFAHSGASDDLFRGEVAKDEHAELDGHLPPEIERLRLRDSGGIFEHTRRER